MRWSSIVSFISYARIAECLDIDTSNEFITDGKVTPEGLERIFQIVSEEGLSEEEHVKRENELLTEVMEEYVSPEQLVRKINWEDILNKVNNYTAHGSRLDFLESQDAGLAVTCFATSDGFSLTLFEPVMVFINDAQYAEDSTLPEFGFEDIGAEELFVAIDQASQAQMIDVPDFQNLLSATS